MRAAFLALFLTGCLVTPVQRREDTLVREAHEFNDDIRWGRYEQLHLSLPPEEAALLSSRAAAMGDDLVVGDYEVTSIHFASGSEAATALVKFDWYSKRDSILHSSTIEQRWEFQAGKWMVTKQRRLRGDRFPLVTEPASPPPASPPPAP
jgi:hypothetical protein